MALSRVDRLVAVFSPAAAARRARARMVLEGYAAAKDSRLRNARRTSSGPNQATGSSAKNLRSMARAFEEDSDIAKRALDIIVTNVVGQEIIPEPMVKLAGGEPAHDLNRVLSRWHRRWRARPEASHTHNHGSAQRLAVRTWARDGELFTQDLIGDVPSFRHHCEVPYSYELISPDRCPIELTNTDKGRIIQGVALNDWRQPQAYFFLPDEPNDGDYTRSLYVSLADVKRKSADTIHHLASRSRINQVRGVSMFATVLSRLEDINEIDEAERVAARIAASIGLAVFDPNAPQMPTSITDEEREIEWAPGMTLHLDHEAKVEVFGSDRPNDKLPEFIRRQLQHVAGGVGVGYSTLALDYRGNYSSQRQELVEVFGVYGVLYAEFLDKWELPKYRRFIEMATKFVPEVRKAMREAGDLDISTLYDAEFSRPVMPWVDPEKEVKALTGAYELGIDSKRRMIRSRGLVPDDILAQNAREKDEDSERAAARAPVIQPADPQQNNDDAGAAGDDDEE